MADWSILDRDYSCYDYYPYYQEKEQNAPAQCVQQPYSCPSPTLTLLLSPPPPCYQPPKGDNPREIRNKAEKQRRDKMNQSVLRLASIVPTVAKPGRKLNKTSVLRLAAHYLRSHQHVFGNSIDRGPEFSLKFTETLLKNLKGFLITTTYKGIVVVVSPNVQEYLGYTELELLGQNLFNIIHKDDHQLLREQLYPRSCTLTPRGELSIPNEIDAEQNISNALANEKRSFVVRLRKLNQQRSEPPQYITCHIEGSLRKADHAGSRGEQAVHIGRRARSRGDNPSSSGNDIVFVGMVRPTAETFVTEGVLESFRMEYRTRHSIDGEIIQCEQRIALVTGYMTHEVSGVNAMNFMHRDDVRWVIIALREMYDQHRLVGESCYRLMTKNGQFIYMRTLGRLDVDQNSKAVTSFVCTNTVVAEQEGKQLIKLMKKKFTLMINNNEEPKEEIEISEQESEKQTPPVEDPKQLEKVILHLVTDLPSDKNHLSLDNDESSSHLAIIPPRKEKIHEAIEKSYSVIRSCCFTMAGKKRKDSKKNARPKTPKQTQPINEPGSSQANEVQPIPETSQNCEPQVPCNSSWSPSRTTNKVIDTTNKSSVGMASNSDQVSEVSRRYLPPRHECCCVNNRNINLPGPSQPDHNARYQNIDGNEYYDLQNLQTPLMSDFLLGMLNDVDTVAQNLKTQGYVPGPSPPFPSPLPQSPPQPLPSPQSLLSIQSHMSSETLSSPQRLLDPELIIPNQQPLIYHPLQQPTTTLQAHQPLQAHRSLLSPPPIQLHQPLQAHRSLLSPPPIQTHQPLQTYRSLLCPSPIQPHQALETHRSLLSPPPLQTHQPLQAHRSLFSPPPIQPHQALEAHRSLLSPPPLQTHQPLQAHRSLLSPPPIQPHQSLEAHRSLLSPPPLQTHLPTLLSPPPIQPHHLLQAHQALLSPPPLQAHQALLSSPPLQAHQTLLSPPPLRRASTQALVLSPPLQQAGTLALEPSPPLQPAGTQALLPSPPLQQAGIQALVPSAPLQQASTQALIPSPPLEQAETQALVHSPPLHQADSQALVPSPSLQQAGTQASAHPQPLQDPQMSQPPQRRTVTRSTSKGVNKSIRKNTRKGINKSAGKAGKGKSCKNISEPVSKRIKETFSKDISEPVSRGIINKRKKTCYSDSLPASMRSKRYSDIQTKKKENDEEQLPKEIEEMIARELSKNELLERKGQLPFISILADDDIDIFIESVETVDGISSRNFNEVISSLQDSGKYYEDPSEEETEENQEEEKKRVKTRRGDVYEFNNGPKQYE